MPHLTESTVSREPSCLPLTLPSDIPSDIQSDTQGERGSLETAAELQRAVKQVVSAAERIEQAVCRFEHTGGKVDSTLDAIGTQIESLSEFHNQPSCRELFEQISELHQTVAEELAAIERKAAENSFAESQPSVMPETSDFRETRENDPESPISLKCTAPHEMEKPLSPPGGSIVRGFAGELRVSLPDGTKRRFDPGLAVKKPDMPGPIRRASLTRPNTNTPTGTDTTPDATKDAKNPEDTKQDEGLTEWKKASTPFKPNVEFRPRRRP